MIQAGEKIVIGIPSYNEEDTIGNVVSQVDLGLKKFYPAYKNLIINDDSNSADNTKGIFLRTQTFYPKEYINTGTKIRGKPRRTMKLFLLDLFCYF